MKKRLFLAILAVVLFLAGTTAAGAAILYVDTYNSTSEVSSLYTLTTTGTTATATKVGDIKEDGTINRQFTDIALDINTGTMYAITTDTLYTLDNYSSPSGGIITATAVGSTGVTDDLQGLEVSSTSTIYAASIPLTNLQNGTLYTLSSSDGHYTSSFTFFPTTTPPNYTFWNYGDLAFGGTTLYGSLDRRNPGGQGQKIGIAPIELTGGIDPDTFFQFSPAVYIDGLAYVSQTSTLYGISRDANLYSIDPATGDLTAITTTGFAAGDVPYGMTVPIPASALLLGSGLLGLGLLGWRRQKRH